MLEILTFLIALWLIRALHRRSSPPPSNLHIDVWHHWPDKGPGEPSALTEEQLRELCYRSLREPDPEPRRNNVVPFRVRLGDDR